MFYYKDSYLDYKFSFALKLKFFINFLKKFLIGLNQTT